MSIRNTRLSEADVDQHIADLIYFGENPKAEVFGIVSVSSLPHMETCGTGHALSIGGWHRRRST